MATKSVKLKTGRKWFDGKSEQTVLTKCQEVWALGGTDAEAAFYAEISTASISRYLDMHPETKEFRNQLLLKPILLARRTVVKSLSNPSHAQWYLERKRKAEFSSRSELTGAEGRDIMPSRKEEIRRALENIL